MPTFYRIDDRRCSVAECWRFSPSLAVFLGFLVKTRWFHQQMTRDVIAVRLDGITRVPLQDFPKEVQKVLRQRLREMESEGFLVAFADEFPRLTDEAGYRITSVSPDATVVAGAQYAKKGPLVRSNVVLHTELSDGRIITTSDAARRFDPTPGVHVAWLPRGVALKRAVSVHAQRVARQQVAPVPISEERLDAFLIHLNHLGIDHQLRRGLLVPLNDDERDQVAKKGAAATPAKVVRPRPAIWFVLIMAVVAAHSYFSGTLGWMRSMVFWSALTGAILTVRKPRWGQ
jgi:hypothetical protein